MQQHSRRAPARTGNGGDNSWVFWPVLFLIGGIWAGAAALVKAARHHPGQALGIAGAVLFYALVVACVWFANRQEKKRPLPAGPQAPPICSHADAVKVENMLNPDAPAWAWLCYECDPEKGTPLPAEFGNLKRLCCGTPHGGPHLASCPRYRSPDGSWPDIRKRPS